MPLRQLPDGSWLDTMTGSLSGFDPGREAVGRALAIRAGARSGQLAGGGNPTPPLPVQKLVALPGIRGPQAIIDPQQRLLNPNPFELGMGNFLTPENKGKMMVLGIGLAGCAAFVWWSRRQKAHKAAKASE